MVIIVGLSVLLVMVLLALVKLVLTQLVVMVMVQLVVMVMVLVLALVLAVVVIIVGLSVALLLVIVLTQTYPTQQCRRTYRKPCLTKGCVATNASMGWYGTDICLFVIYLCGVVYVCMLDHRHLH